jgi:hypothetical protein
MARLLLIARNFVSNESTYGMKRANVTCQVFQFSETSNRRLALEGLEAHLSELTIICVLEKAKGAETKWNWVLDTGKRMALIYNFNSTILSFYSTALKSFRGVAVTRRDCGMWIVE